MSSCVETNELCQAIWLRIDDLRDGLDENTYLDNFCGTVAEAAGYDIDEHIKAYQIALAALLDLRRCCALLTDGVA